MAQQLLENERWKVAWLRKWLVVSAIIAGLVGAAGIVAIVEVGRTRCPHYHAPGTTGATPEKVP